MNSSHLRNILRLVTPSGKIHWVLLPAIFLLSLSFFYFNQRHFSQVTLARQDIIFGSDTIEVVEALTEVTFERDMRKHVLFSATLVPIIHATEQVFSVSPLRAIRLVLAALAALNIALVFLILSKHITTLSFSILFTVLYAFSFSNLVIFSIPETYAASNLVVILYLLVFMVRRNAITWGDSLGLAGLAALAALFNHPLLSLVGIHLLVLLFQTRFTRWVQMAFASLGLALAVFLSINLTIYGTEVFQFWTSYSNQWASIENLLNPNAIANVFSNFFLFAVVTPVNYPPNTLGWQSWVGYLGSASGFVLAASLVIGLLVAFGYFIAHKKPRHTWVLGLFAWVTVMTTFYIYFNPVEAMLYASQIFAPLVFILAEAFHHFKRNSWFKMGLAAFCVLLIIHNLPALYAPVPGL